MENALAPTASAPDCDQRALRRYRAVAFGALVFLYLIMVTGATVRLTGSGLGCPNWPSCHGARPIPSAIAARPLVEFTNRMMSLPTTVFALTAWIMALRLRPRRRDLRWGSGLAVLGVLAQIVLGGLTVLLKLPPIMVAVHFLVSICILAAATWAWHAGASPRPLSLLPRSRSHTSSRGRAPAREKQLLAATLAMLVVGALVIVAGTLTTASGPHSGAAPGQLVHRLNLWSIAVTIHARLSYAFAGLVIAVTLWRRNTRRTGTRDLGIITALVLLQITLGEIQYRNGLPWQMVLLHVSNAALLWSLICLAAWRAAAPLPAKADAAAHDPGAGSLDLQHDSDRNSRAAGARSHALR
jgi:cytochrome c oxidase assembly protein subunit 15